MESVGVNAELAEVGALAFVREERSPLREFELMSNGFEHGRVNVASRSGEDACFID